MEEGRAARGEVTRESAEGGWGRGIRLTPTPSPPLAPQWSLAEGSPPVSRPFRAQRGARKGVESGSGGGREDTHSANAD